jgi:transglutaminase-like putative cysteine protease
MRFRIRHVTSYRYERPVTLGSHVFRMQPHGEGLRLDGFKLSMYPPPAMISPGFDDAGNPVHTAVFEGEISEFRVSVLSEGETFAAPGPSRPEGVFPLPPYYGEDIGTLWKYRVVDSAEGAEGEVAALARAVAMDAGGEAYAFLDGLSRALFDRVRNVSRLLGAPHAPEVTLREGLGSCRDFAVLFAACCRHQGIAARFVSGYIPAPAGESQHMHAWAEAHVPGLGWTAWDATQGGPAGESHIRVAASAEPAEAAPIAGSYRGLSDSTMSVELSVEIG